MATIRVTGMDTFTDQEGGTLVLVNPDDTPRPINYWSCLVGGEHRSVRYTALCSCSDTANNKSIYITSSTSFPVLLIEETGGNYTFDSDKTREHVNRIWVTSDPALKTGDDYRCPLRRADITKV